jgi:hypothetical protein
MGLSLLSRSELATGQRSANNEFERPQAKERLTLTGRQKFDNFKRFAQKRRLLQRSAKTGERNKFEDTWA